MIFCSYRNAYFILSRQQRRFEKLPSVCTSYKNRLRRWFEGMWTFIFNYRKTLLRAPKLSLQMAINSILDTPAQLWPRVNS